MKIRCFWGWVCCWLDFGVGYDIVICVVGWGVDRLRFVGNVIVGY